MSDNRKYYYLKLKENYFDDDSIVLLESMQDGVLYSNILLKLYLKSLKHGGRLQLDEDIIDDLGVERSTEYAMEQMFFVIDSRYRSRRPMIITTNLKLSELKNPPDLAHARIYDRILERCAPILFDGKNFREENAGATRQAAKDIVSSKHD